jgi:carotenoid cleavage dioxygenase-like enzyme
VKFAGTTTDEHQKGDIIGQFTFPERFFGVSESTVIPKKGNDGEYMAVIATNVPEGVTWQDVQKDSSLAKSQAMILDGDALEAGPVYTATLPYMVPFGLHSSFVGWESTMK